MFSEMKYRNGGLAWEYILVCESRQLLLNGETY